MGSSCNSASTEFAGIPEKALAAVLFDTFTAGGAWTDNNAATSDDADVGNVRARAGPSLTLVLAIQTNPATAGSEMPTNHHLFMSRLTSNSATCPA